MNSFFKIQKLDLLIAVYLFSLAVSEFMGAKTFPLTDIVGFRLNASVAIFTIPLLFSINDIVIEVFGKERAISIVRSGFVFIALIFLFSLLAISLPPSPRFAPSEAAYDSVFAKSARFSAASLTAFAISAVLDILIFVRIRQAMHKKALWLRNNASNIISQFFDTVIFITLAFYAFNQSFGDNFAFLAGIILPYWLLKCFMSVIETPLVYAGVRWLKGEKSK